MKKSLIVAVLLVGMVVLPSFAQEDEVRPATYSFQGRVGMLFTGGEPFENGAAFEIGMMVRLAGPLHLNISGGTSNFNGGAEVVPLTTEFADFWEEFLTIYNVYDIEKSTYRINFFNLGGAIKFGAGAFEPYVVAGAGIYYVRFSVPFSYAAIGFPPETAAYTNITDSKYLYGFNFGGGINFKINDLIGFGGQVTYHYINSDALENQLMTTFGLNVTLP
jgi:hypothetical protein